MKVGGLEETITVTGETSIVDVQSAKRQRTLDSEMVQSIPTAKGYAGLMVLIPSMVQSGGGVPTCSSAPAWSCSAAAAAAAMRAARRSTA